MLKNQIGANLSVSDTHLYRQFDGTASNNPLTAHTMKNKSDRSQTQTTTMTSQVYSTEPRVRKAGPPPRSTVEPRGGTRIANFVPIPELGIFTPEQHVLQNGTYAQHCHLREVNNNNNGNSNSSNNSHSSSNINVNFNNSKNNMVNSGHDRGGHHPHNNGFPSDSRSRVGGHDSQSYVRNQHAHSNMAPDHTTYSQTHSSRNTSFESGSQRDYYNSADRHVGGERYDNRGGGDYKAQNPPQNGVYHSCMDISALPSTDRDFNSLKSNSSVKPTISRAEPIPEAYSQRESGVNSSSNDHDVYTINSDQTYAHKHRYRHDNEGRPRRRKDMPPPKVESPSKKLEQSSRSHSLGDLSSGCLTFSLVGQKKPDSLLSVATCPSTGKVNISNKLSDSGAGARYSYVEQSNNSLNHGQGFNSCETTDASDTGDEVDGDFPPRSKGGSALQHIRERLQKAVLNSQRKFQAHSSKGANSNKTAPPSSNQQRESAQPLLKSSTTSPKSREPPYLSNVENDNQTSPNQNGRYGNYTHHFGNSQTRYPQGYQSQEQHSTNYPQPVQSQEQHSTNYPQPVQSQEQHSTNYPPPVQSVHSPNSARYSRQYSAPDGSSSSLQTYTTSPKRRDSVDTTSSYQSALSDPSQFNSQLLSAWPTAHHQGSSSSSNNKRSELSADRHSIANPPTEREKSPVKPKRSLPQVSLTETSERIKRFTEIMKSRMSNHSSASNSRNGYSADGASSGSQCTPTRVSSVETTASARSVSRKSSMEGVSDSEMGNSKTFSPRNPDDSLFNGEQRGAHPHSHNAKEYQEHSQWGDKNRSPIISGHSRNSYTMPNSASSDNHRKVDQRPRTQSLYNNRYENNGTKQVDRGRDTSNCQNNSYTSQGHGMNPEDVPLPPGDRSSDSGQTSGTSNSYIGSVPDSGYTTNNDGESDPYHYHHPTNNNTNFHHQSQYGETQQPSHPAQILDQRSQYSQQQASQHMELRNSQPRQEKRRPPPSSSSRHRSNLMNSRQFGSVQNVSSAQAHGNPKDTDNNVWQPLVSESTTTFGSLPRQNGIPLLPDQNKPTVRAPLSAKEYSNRNQNAQILTNVHNALIAPADSKRQPDPYQYNKAATRRSWDYSDGHGFGRVENEMSHQHRSEARYRSTDVISYKDNVNSYRDSQHLWDKTSRQPQTESNFRTVNASSNDATHYTQQQQQQQYASHHHSSNHPSNELSSLMTRSYDRDPRKDKQASHSYKNITSSASIHTHNSQQSHNSDKDPRSTDISYRSAMPVKTSEANLEGVKQRPVPISRSNRNIRGRTLPSSFQFNESDLAAGFGQAAAFNFELSLYHLTQKYDVSPLCLDLPKHLTLKDMVSFKEITVDISLNQPLGVPSSPQGQAAKIGSPGSAFTPVKNELQISNPPAILKVKVLSFTNIWKEMKNHCILGLLLETDILVEVNGWFCLGADLVYLQRIVENCQGAITLTVARPRESDVKRYKGQTAAERVKSLESEISRLDQLIHTRDEKIKEMTAAAAAASSGKQVLSNINGEMPCEGMIIGDDEYVV